MNKSEVVKVITEMNVVDPRVEPIRSENERDAPWPAAFRYRKSR